VLSENSLERIKISAEYWAKMSREPHREIQGKWAKCERHWVKINQVMKDIGLPKFGTPDDFVDLRDIVESHTKQDSSWAERLAKVTDTAPGQVQQFLEHPIRARVVLQQLSASLVKYQGACGGDQRSLRTPMEQHRFPYAQTCEELFISWSSMRKVTLSSDILS
jgi:hypothetical protein